MLTERKYGEIAPRLFTVNGGQFGEITIADTCDFRVKQSVTIKSDSQAAQVVEIKRILSTTEILVGPRSPDMTLRTDLSAFTTGDNSTIQLLEGNSQRPGIDAKQHERAVYEEEPVIAKRSILVDKYGRRIGTKADDAGNIRLLVDLSDTEITDTLKKTPTIMNVPILLANTELTLVLPQGVKSFIIKVREARAKLQIAWNQTESSTNFFTISKGVAYSEEGLSLDTNLSLYYQSNRPNVTLEVQYWT